VAVRGKHRQRERRMRRRILWVETDRAKKGFARAKDLLGALRREAVQAEQVRVVRFDVIGARAVPLRKRVAEQTYLERRRDAARDLVLNREDVRELAVVRSGPKMRVGRDVDELRGDPDVAASSANT